jgi:hypothetical protein
MRKYVWLTSVALVAAILAAAAVMEYADNHPSSVLGRGLVRMALAWQGTSPSRPAPEVVDQASLPEACAQPQHVAIIDIGPESDDTILRDLQTICELARLPELITVAPKQFGDAEETPAETVDEFTPRSMPRVSREGVQFSSTPVTNGSDASKEQSITPRPMEQVRSEFETLLEEVSKHGGSPDALNNVVAGHGPETAQSAPTKPDGLDNIINGKLPPGNFHSDLDIPINNASFNTGSPAATPQPKDQVSPEVGAMLVQCDALMKAGRAAEAVTLAQRAYRLYPESRFTWQNLEQVHRAMRAQEAAAAQCPKVGECPCGFLAGMFDYLGCWLDGFFGNSVEVEINVNAPLPVPPPPPPLQPTGTYPQQCPPLMAGSCPQGCPPCAGCHVAYPNPMPPMALDQQMITFMAWPYGMPHSWVGPDGLERVGIDFEGPSAYVTRTYQQPLAPMAITPVTILDPFGRQVTCYVHQYPPVPHATQACCPAGTICPPVMQATFVPAQPCPQCPVPQSAPQMARPPVYSTPFGFDIYRPQPQTCVPYQPQMPVPMAAPGPWSSSPFPAPTPPDHIITIAPCPATPCCPPAMARTAAPCCEQSACEKALAKKISITFDDKPLAEALDELREMAGVNIVTDQPALDDAGIDMDQTVSMKLTDVPAWVALKRVLHNCRLAYKVEDDIVVVSTPKSAFTPSEARHGPLTTVVYPVKDLVGTDEATFMADCLLNILMSTVEPATWDPMGGDGFVDFFPTSHALVVQQTPEVHKQVAQLIQQLRQAQHGQALVSNRAPMPSAPVPPMPSAPAYDGMPVPPLPPAPYGMVPPPPLPPTPYGLVPPVPYGQVPPMAPVPFVGKLPPLPAQPPVAMMPPPMATICENAPPAATKASGCAKECCCANSGSKCCGPVPCCKDSAAAKCCAQACCKTETPGKCCCDKECCGDGQCCCATACCKDSAAAKCCCAQACGKDSGCAKCCCENERQAANVICTPRVRVALADGSIMDIQIQITKNPQGAITPVEFECPVPVPPARHPKDLPSEIPEDLPEGEECIFTFGWQRFPL